MPTPGSLPPLAKACLEHGQPASLGGSYTLQVASAPNQLSYWCHLPDLRRAVSRWPQVAVGRPAFQRCTFHLAKIWAMPNFVRQSMDHKPNSFCLEESGFHTPIFTPGFPGSSVVRNLPANVWDEGDAGSISGSGRLPGEGNVNSLPVFFPGKFHGQRSPVGCIPWGCKESDTTEPLNTHTHTHTHTFYCSRKTQLDQVILPIFWGNQKVSSGIKAQASFSESPTWLHRITRWFLPDEKSRAGGGVWQTEPVCLFTRVLITVMFTGKCPHRPPAAPATQPCESCLQSQLPVILLIYVEQLQGPLEVFVAAWWFPAYKVAVGRIFRFKFPSRQTLKSPALLLIFAMWAL